MSKLLIKKAEGATIVNHVFDMYFVQANKYINVINSKIMTEISNLLKKIKKHIKKLYENAAQLNNDIIQLQLDELCAILFNSFSNINIVNDSLKKTHSLLSNDIRIHEDSNISTTSSNEMLDMLNKMLHLYTNYLIEGNILDETILQQFVTILFSNTKSIAGEPYKIIQVYYRLSDITVKLYAEYIKQLLNHYYSTKDQRSYILTKQLEHDKTWQLIQYDIDAWNTSRFNNVPKIKVQNPFISEWGLISQTLVKSLTEILQTLFGIDHLPDVQLNKIQHSVDHISKIKRENIRLIVIKKVMPQAIEHDISRIIGEHSKDYKIKDQYGINSKILQKFNILKINPTNMWDFNIELYKKLVDTTDQKPKSYYIIETLDNITFRIVAPYLVKKCQYAINDIFIPRLLEFINKKPEMSRITEYNKTLELAMYKNIKSMPTLQIQKLTLSSSQTIDIGIVRQRIKKSLMDIYDQYASPGKTSDLSYLRELIFLPELVQQLIDIQIYIYLADKSYFKLIVDPTLKRKAFDQNDVFITFLLHVNKTIRGFQRDMNENFREISKNMIVNEIKGWSHDRRKMQFRICFGQILDATIKHIFTSEHNVYQYVRFKVDIFNSM